MKKHLQTCLFLGLAMMLTVSAAWGLPETPPQTRLSPEARMSLLTASPGEALYSAFGHSALWVSDPVMGIDEVYNWGTFDFNAPNFYLNFIRGRLWYMLTVVPLQAFLWEYDYQGRSMHEQVLNLNAAEKEKIYEYLQYNRRPENVHYLYDFFYDNCATRIRDLVETYLSIDWGPDPHPHEERSFRHMVRPYVAHLPWISFGIDLVMGLPSDIAATPWHYMFLPDEMLIAFDQARHADGRPLVTEQTELLPMVVEFGQPFPLTPIVVFWVLFAAGILSYFHSKVFRIFRMAWFAGLGILGLVIFFLWFVSDHLATATNLNLLWALPTHLIVLFGAARTTGVSVFHRISRVYFWIVFVINAALLLLWPLNPQGLHPAFFPIIALAAFFSLTMLIKSPRIA